jgi:hypothetical protein
MSSMGEPLGNSSIAADGATVLLGVSRPELASCGVRVYDVATGDIVPLPARTTLAVRVVST